MPRPESFPSKDQLISNILKAQTPAEALQLSNKAQVSEARAQYRRIALLLHPDKDPGQHAVEAFHKASNALQSFQSPIATTSRPREHASPSGDQQAKTPTSSAKSRVLLRPSIVALWKPAPLGNRVPGAKVRPISRSGKYTPLQGQAVKKQRTEYGRGASCRVKTLGEKSPYKDQRDPLGDAKGRWTRGVDACTHVPSQISAPVVSSPESLPEGSFCTSASEIQSESSCSSESLSSPESVPSPQKEEGPEQQSESVGRRQLKRLYRAS